MKSYNLEWVSEWVSLRERERKRRKGTQTLNVKGRKRRRHWHREIKSEKERKKERDWGKDKQAHPPSVPMFMVEEDDDNDEDNHWHRDRWAMALRMTKLCRQCFTTHLDIHHHRNINHNYHQTTTSTTNTTKLAVSFTISRWSCKHFLLFWCICKHVNLQVFQVTLAPFFLFCIDHLVSSDHWSSVWCLSLNKHTYTYTSYFICGQSFLCSFKLISSTFSSWPKPMSSIGNVLCPRTCSPEITSIFGKR